MTLFHIFNVKVKILIGRKIKIKIFQFIQLLLPRNNNFIILLLDIRRLIIILYNILHKVDTYPPRFYIYILLTS